MRPFYAYKEGEPYYLYFDPAAANRISHRGLSYQGSWHDGSAFHFTNSVGATVECKFQGTGVRWLGFRFDDAGKAEVSIDGKVVATVDQYGPGRDLPFEWSAKEPQARRALNSPAAARREGTPIEGPFHQRSRL